MTSPWRTSSMVESFSISRDRLIQVPLRGTAKVGLRRGVELSGEPLTVEPDAPGIVRVVFFRAHGDLRLFTLAGVDTGDTTLKAVAKGGAVMDRVEVHVHRPRVRQLPRFDDLFENYAGDEEASDDFKKRIGGQVDNPQLTNTCALRMSEAFNGTSQPIPHAHKGLITVRGGDKRFYAIRVAEFKRYMLDHYARYHGTKAPAPAVWLLARRRVRSAYGRWPSPGHAESLRPSDRPS